MSGVLYYDVANSQYLDVDGTSDTFTNAIEADTIYMVLCNQDFWITWGSSPTAAVDTAGSILWPKNTPFFFKSPAADTVAMIQDSAAGDATLTKVGTSL